MWCDELIELKARALILLNSVAGFHLLAVPCTAHLNLTEFNPF